MRRRRFNGDGRTEGPRREDKRRSEAGDTLVEILIALAVIGIAATAILLAFATSISGSGEHRNLATMDTMLRTASAEVTSAIQQQSNAVFSSCSGAYQLNQQGIALPNPSAPSPNPYSASITGAQYWNSAATPAPAFTGLPWTPTTSCPGGVTGGGPQLLTVTVNFNGSSGAASSSITTVVDNPNSPPPASSCGDPATQLVWVAQPGNGSAGSALYPAPTLVLEDGNDCVEQTDASQVKLSVSSGPGTLSNCVPNLGYGETTFQDCALDVPGTYTLTATDVTDGITSTVSNSFVISQGAPAKLVFDPNQEPGNGTGGSPLSTQPIVYVEDANGNIVAGDRTTVTLAIGTNPGGGTLSGCTGTSNGNGQVTFLGCTIDKVGTGYTLTATDAADNLTTASTPSSPFNITPGQPYRLAFTTTPGTTVAGDPFGTQPVVTLLDAGGNTATVAPGSTNAVGLAIGANPGGSAVSGCTETTTAGVAKFAGCSISQPGNGYTLVASDTTNPAVLTATSGPFNIVTPALTSFKVVPASNTQTAGTAFNVTITALDQSGYTFPGFTGSQAIAFTGPATSPNGHTPSYPATINFSGGVGTGSITLYDAQTTTLTATQGLVTGTSGNITVNPLTTATAYSVANPGNQVAGVSFSESISAVDTYGNVVTSYSGGKTLTFSGPANSPNGTAPKYPTGVFGGNNATFNSGVATVSITLYDAQSTALTVKLGTTLSGVSTGFTVTGGNTAGGFTVANPGTQTAGTAFSVSITATDPYGNPATAYTGNQTLTFSGPANAPNGNAPSYPAGGVVSFSGGVGTAQVTLYKASTTTNLNVSQSAASGSTGSFTVTGGSTTAFTLSAPSPTAGSAFTETLTQVDNYGNSAATFTGSQAVSFANPHNAPNGNAPLYPSTVTFNTSGVGTASITLYDAETTTLQATMGLVVGTSPSFSVGPASASTLTVTGFPSPTTAGASHNVTVTAYDAYGNVATGYTGTVHFTSSDPQSTAGSGLPANYTFTAGNAGTRTFSATLKTVGTQSITATDTVTGTITGTQSGITVNVGAATHFTVTGYPSPTTAGVSHAFTVTAYDAYGNVATGYTGTVHFTSSDGQAALPANYTFTAANAGVDTFSATLKTAGTQSITATDTVTGTITGTQSGITVNAAGASKLAFVQQPTATTAGSAIAPAVTVQVQDPYGNAVADSGATVAMTVSTGPGAFTGGSTTSATTNAAGLATFNNLVLNTSGSYTIGAASSPLTAATSGSFTVNAAGATHFTVTGYPSPTTAGASHNVTVTAYDAYGNVATGYAGTVHFTSSDAQAALPANATLTAGTGTFSATLKTAGTQSITATDTVTGTITGTQSGITVNAAGASKLAFVQQPTNTQAGSAISPAVTVQVQDPYGNAVADSGATVTMSVASGTGSFTGGSTTSATTNAAGLATFNNLVLNTASNYTIGAASSPLTAATSSGFTVTAAPASHFTVTGFTSPTTAGAAHNVTVTAYDAYGNVATGYTGTVHFTSSDGQAALPANYTFTGNGGDNGVHVFSATLKTVGSQSITATDTVTGTITGTQSGITVNPARRPTSPSRATPARPRPECPTPSR